MEKDIKLDYNSLKKKYSLPDFKEVDNEFEISDIENTSFLLRRICERINERVGGFAAFLEELMQSDSSIKSLHELRYLDENDKKEMYALYKLFAVYNREFLLVSLSSDESEQAQFITKLAKEWKASKERLAKLIEKIKKSWGIEADIQEELGYLG